FHPAHLHRLPPHSRFPARGGAGEAGGRGMTQKQWSEVDRYISDWLVPPDPALDAALESSEAAGLPAINVSPNQGKLLMLLAQLICSPRIVEIWTVGRYS